MSEKQKKIKVGLIGFGLSGKVFHTPLMQAHGGYEIKKIMSSRTAEINSLLPEVAVVTKVEEILSDPQIDLVVNTGPNEYHYPHTAAALEAGKHVVVEKPFVVSSSEGEKLISLSAKVGKSLTVFHNRRWDSDFLTIQQVLLSGKLGEIKQFESHFDRFRPNTRANRWREQPIQGSGILYDLGSHLIDQALMLFGLPKEIFADVDSQKVDGEVDDYFHLILKYDKMRVLLHGSSFTNVTPRFQILGTKGSFVKYGLDPQEEELRAGSDPNDVKFGLESPESFGTLTSYNGDMGLNERVPSSRGCYLSFYKDLYENIMVGQLNPPVTAKSALDVIRLIELAFISTKERRVVSIEGDHKS